MPIGFREKTVAGIVLAASFVATAYHAVERRGVDPCETDPEAYACAVFAQPEWVRRRVYAGRMTVRPTPAATPAADVETTSASREVDGI